MFVGLTVVVHPKRKIDMYRRDFNYQENESRDFNERMRKTFIQRWAFLATNPRSKWVYNTRQALDIRNTIYFLDYFITHLSRRQSYIIETLCDDKKSDML